MGRALPRAVSNTDSGVVSRQGRVRSGSHTTRLSATPAVAPNHDSAATLRHAGDAAILILSIKEKTGANFFGLVPIRHPQVCQALKSAYWRRKPPAGLIMHSDRGSQYASDSHRKLIRDYRMIQSMSRKADCWDNATMESFFKTLKVERVHRLRYDTRALAKLDIVDWIEGFYNRTRMQHAFINRIQDTGRCGVRLDDCLTYWCTSNRGKVNQ